MPDRFAGRSLEQEAQCTAILAGLRYVMDPQDGLRLADTELIDQICRLFLAGPEISDLQQTLPAELASATQGASLQGADTRKLVRLNALFARSGGGTRQWVAFRMARTDQDIRVSPVCSSDAPLCSLGCDTATDASVLSRMLSSPYSKTDPSWVPITD
jgi:hypothetical protein